LNEKSNVQKLAISASNEPIFKILDFISYVFWGEKLKGHIFEA